MDKRRHAAIMFTDIVGYTSLMGSDEDRAFEVLRKNRVIHSKFIEQYNGTLIKEMGDGMLVSFSLASDAVRCAIEIQKVSKEQNIPLKIGIHEGEMVFEGSDVLGDGVNVASRLQEDTEEGCISISGAVNRDVKNKTGISTEFAEEKTFKNVDEPVKVYKVFSEETENKEAPEISSKKETKKSIAVLPFVNMSNDPEQEYFCDGMSEEIINALTHIENLKVIARTSTFEFKNKNEDIRKIGRKLDVLFLLEGSVRKAGNRLRITAQLITIADGSHLWSERYDREMKDVFEIQDEISMAIVDKLKIKLFEKEKEKVLKSKTKNLEAYKLYLKGRHQWNKRTKEGLEKSIEYFDLSIKSDPEFALAYIGLSDAYNMLFDWGYLLPKEAFAKAIKNVLKSLEIDNSLGETYVSLAYLNGFYEWNWREAEKNFNKAIELNPNYPTAHQWYALFLSSSGRFNKALEQINLAMELDPLSLAINLANGIILHNSCRFDEAINQFHSVLEINKKLGAAYIWCSQSNLQKGMHDEAFKEYQNMFLSDPLTTKYVPIIVDIYHDSGIKGMLRWLIDEEIIPNQEVYNKSYYLSLYYTALGDKEHALEHLEQAVDMHNGRIAFSIKTDPVFDTIRSDPRFSILLKKMGLL